MSDTGSLRRVRIGGDLLPEEDLGKRYCRERFGRLIVRGPTVLPATERQTGVAGVVPRLVKRFARDYG